MPTNDGRLTFDEILGADMHKIATKLRDMFRVGGLAAAISNEEADRILDRYFGDLRRDLALGVANESLPSVPIDQFTGDPSALFQYLP